jgi:hypothetical protein
MNDRKLVVLDIDRTLVHACPTIHVQNKWLEWYDHFEFDCYTVFVRPMMKEFLEFLFDHFDVGIFTAGGNEYADVVVKQLFQPQQHLQFVFSSDDCDQCFEETKKMKCMNWLLNIYNTKCSKNLTLQDVKLIDDSHIHMMNNFKCCYLMPQFIVCYDGCNRSINAMKDDKELLLLQEYLLDWKHCKGLEHQQN